MRVSRHVRPFDGNGIDINRIRGALIAFIALKRKCDYRILQMHTSNEVPIFNGYLNDKNSVRLIEL